MWAADFSEGTMERTEWAGEIFAADGRWLGTVACDTGDEMLACLESATFAGFRITGVCRRPVKSNAPGALVINARGPAGLAAARRAIEIAQAEV